MSKNGLRGFGTGIFVACAIIAIYYYMFSHLGSSPSTKSNAGKAITQDQVNLYLANHGQIAVDQATFNKWQISQSQPSTSKSPSSSASKSSTKNTSPTSPAPSKVVKMTLTIKSGMTVWDVATTLEQNKIIKNKQTLYDYMLKNNLDTTLQLGTFQVSSDMSTAQIAKTITK